MDWRLRAARRAQRRCCCWSRSSTIASATCSTATRIGELNMEVVGIVSNHPREALQHLDDRRHPLPPSAGHARRPRPQQEAQIKQLVDGERRRAGRARALHADPVGRSRRLSRRALHQHPPQLPARLQGRQALSPGACARREDDRRDRPLRHRRPRRRADHRPGRRARSAMPTRPTIWSARAATSSAACWRARSIIISRIGCCSTAQTVVFRD